MLSKDTSHRRPAALVTGASGMLGANLTLALLDAGWRVAGQFLHHAVIAPGADMVQADLCDPDAAVDLVRQFRPYWVIHCAATTDVDWCEAHPDEAHVALSGVTSVLARAAAECGARFLYVSTDSVFDGARGGYSETDKPNPVNAYARGKLAGECEALSGCPGALVVRTNLYGWTTGAARKSLGEWVLGKLQRGEQLSGFTDVRFSPLCASDLAGVLIELLSRGSAGIVHVGARDGCSKFEFAREVASVFGLDAGLIDRARMADADLRAPRPMDTTLDCRRLHAMLGKTTPSVCEGVERWKRTRDAGLAARLGSMVGATTDA